MTIPSQLSAVHRRYLEVLGVQPEDPSLGHLSRLVRAHLQQVPFENISKLFYLRAKGRRSVPDLGLFLDGIERWGFGGTCYSNNPHFFGLLQRLGYDVRLCSADMNEPDVHTSLVIAIDGREYLVDMGYAAPFDHPLPRDLDHDYAVALGNERWVLRPRDQAGRSRIEHHRNGECIHWYVTKPQAVQPEFFQPAVEDSFRADSTFMNTVRVVRFGDGWSLSIADLKVIRASGMSCEIQKLAGRDELVAVIEQEFRIPAAITGTALAGLDLDD